MLDKVLGGVQARPASAMHNWKAQAMHRYSVAAHCGQSLA